jgi:hypothetical protein
MDELNPYEMLFRAKWNIPQAAASLGLVACEDSWNRVKTEFREWYLSHPPDYC